MTAGALAGLCLATAVVVAPAGHRAGAADRLAALTSRGGTSRVEPGRSRRGGMPSRRVLVAASGVALVAALASFGPVVGLGCGVGAAGLLVRLTRRPALPACDPATAALLLDLLAGCLQAGVGVADALEGCATADGRVMGERCRRSAAALRGGDPPEAAFAPWALDPALGSAARLLRRTGSSGAAVAEDLRRCAARLRSRRRLETLRRVQQVGVMVVLPLGLCFLPAFVLVAVVPLVLGLAPAL